MKLKNLWDEIKDSCSLTELSFGLEDRSIMTIMTTDDIYFFFLYLGLQSLRSPIESIANFLYFIPSTGNNAFQCVMGPYKCESLVALPSTSYSKNYSNIVAVSMLLAKSNRLYSIRYSHTDRVFQRYTCVHDE